MIRKSVILSLFALLGAASPAASQSLRIGFDVERGLTGVALGRPAVSSCDIEVPRSNGYWETRRVRVWVEGQRRIVHVPAQWGYRYDSCGRRVRYCIRPAYDRVVQDPGCWQYRVERVWVPAACPPTVGRHHNGHLGGYRTTLGQRGRNGSILRTGGRILRR